MSENLPPKITAAEIEPLLAQTQCRECGYDGCAPYAAALVAAKNNGEVAAVNLCRPGGERVMHSLGRALGVDTSAMQPAKLPLVKLAGIEAGKCIGCTLCIQTCPTDAIVGAPKQLHDVIGDDCTGCGLCVPVCPVDCISFIEGGVPDSAARAAEVRALIDAKGARKATAAGALGEAAATLSGSLQDIEYGAPTLALAITPEIQAKMDAARAVAKTKWTEKKVPVAPKMLRKKERDKV